jgi:hypothetical protein
MARPEQIRQLDRQVATAVERAVSDFRDELSRRMRTAKSEIDRALEEVRPSLPETFLSAQDLEEIESASRNAERSAGSGRLLAAIRQLDAARTQATVLEELLEAATAFAGRVGLFLTRGEEVRGWRGKGFGDSSPFAALLFELGETPWTDLSSGTGCVPLSPGDCARITSRFEVPLAQGGTLIPLVLRDQVAATLYADRSEGSPWNPESLQTLVYLAALAIETLPFRSRALTPTLVDLGQGGSLPMWTGLAESTAEWSDGSEAEEAVEVEVAEPEPHREVTAAVSTAVQAPIAAEPSAEPEWISRTVEPVSPWAEPEPTPLVESETTAEIPRFQPEEPIAPEPGETPLPAYSTAAPAPSVAATPAEESTDAYWLEEEVAAAPADVQPPTLEEPLWAAMPVAAEAPPPPPPPAPAPFFVPLPVPPPLPPPLPGSAPLATVAVRAPAVDDDATLMLQRPRQPEPPAPIPPFDSPDEPTHPAMGGRRPGQSTSPIPIPAPRTWQPGETAEVAPPSDLQGPGWAFATTRVPTVNQPASEEAPVHEEARRLARLLVSEIKLYNEERVEDGRRNRDIYERLKEDIDRSRQMYEERVDARAMKGTDYFYQELVRILAAGDAKALGI